MKKLDSKSREIDRIEEIEKLEKNNKSKVENWTKMTKRII